jgi:hypothetical protein
MSDFIIIIISFLFAIGRIFGLKDQIFQALAHLWIGSLIGAAILNHSTILIVMIVGLSVVETLCFIIFRKLNVTTNKTNT